MIVPRSTSFPLACTIAACILAAYCTVAPPARAGTVTCSGGTCALSDTYSVTLQSSCSTFAAVGNTTAESIGAYDAVANASAADVGSKVSYSVKCTQGATTPKFWVDGGLHASSGIRRLSDLKSPTAHFLNYKLCDVSACTNSLAIGTSSTNSTSLTGNSSTFVSQNTPGGTGGAALQFGFIPEIAAGQDVPTGTYSDTINVAINF